MNRLNEIIPDLNWIQKLKGRFRVEAMASLVGSVLVIPQAISFAYLAGLPPEYGIYSAIFITFIASLFGQTPMLGGPNTAVAILIGLAVSPYAGLGSPLFVEYVLILSIMVGVIQLIFWFFRGARVFDFFSPAGIVAIMTGVGVILIISSIDGILGVDRSQNLFFYEKIYYLISSFDQLVNYYSLSIALITIISGLILKSLNHRYYILISIIIGSIFATILLGIYPQVESEVELLGYIPMQLSLSPPNFTNDHFIVAEKMIIDAIIIAFVGISQSLIITKDLSYKFNKTYNQNKEVFAQAASNIFSGFAGSFAGSGSFNRTTISTDVGSTTPLPGLLSALIIFLIVYLLNPLLASIPMAVISGVLLLVGVAMIKTNKIKTYLKSKDDKIIFIIVFLTTIILGLKIGIVLSLVLSILIYIKNTSNLSYKYSSYNDLSIVTLTGNLFYATTDQLRVILSRVKGDKNILLNINNVGLVDLSCADQINRINRDKEYGNISILCSNDSKRANLKPLNLNSKVFKTFEDATLSSGVNK
jgi:SulP family sulfate permease